VTSRDAFHRSIDRLSSRRLILVGGKGGAGKTTISATAALHLAKDRDVVLFSSDPASNLDDLFDHPVDRVRLESLDAARLYSEFLGAYRDLFVEAGDRGTYLDREEFGRLFELALPGVDELMAWLRIADLVAENPSSIVIADTAPTGHTLRMLSSGSYFQGFVAALDDMQQKHRDMVLQLMRRRATDSVDEMLAALEKRFGEARELLSDETRTAFLPVTLPEPLVIEQTRRLITAVRTLAIDVPFAILNRAAGDPCDRCREQRNIEAFAASEMGIEIVAFPRLCKLIGSIDDLDELQPSDPPAGDAAIEHGRFAMPTRMLFVAGKGGVGKTSITSSIALQLAARGKRTVAISVDPAHSLPLLLEGDDDLLAVEAVDSKSEWLRLREKLDDEISAAFRSLTPSNLSLPHDEAVMRQLLDVGPPGADEIFAIARLDDLLRDAAIDHILVDTAPTGHFLRLLELPKTAGEWVRELMRILLRYRELVSTAKLGEELLKASRALGRVAASLTDGTSSVLLVTRAEPTVIGETLRLWNSLKARSIEVAAVVINAMTPASGCPCDDKLRKQEIETSEALSEMTRQERVPLIAIERRDPPPSATEDLRALVPMEETRSDG
jgi:arsenite/tail-anchored protein-transporting ATPase